MPGFIHKLLPEESPLRLLESHASTVLEASKYIKKGIVDYFNGKNVDDYSESVEKLEREADQIKARLRMSYYRVKYKYFQSGDLMYLVHEQDSVIDGIDDVLKLLRMNTVKGLERTELPRMYIALADSVETSVQEMIKCVRMLLILVESSFSPAEVRRESEEIMKVEDHEFATDNESVEIGKKLYSMKEEIHPVDFYFLEQLAMTISEISDDAENVAEAILTILKT